MCRSGHGGAAGHSRGPVAAAGAGPLPRRGQDPAGGGALGLLHLPHGDREEVPRHRHHSPQQENHS